MLSNYYTLATIAADLDKRLLGKTIREAFTQEKNQLVLLFDGMPDGLVISCAPEINTLYLHSDTSRARRNSVDVLKALPGKMIGAVSIQSMDRVIALSLHGGMTLYSLFFGSKANVLLVDKEQKIVDAFKDARTLIGTTYAPPHGDRVHDIALLRSLIEQEPAQTVFSLIKRAFPVLGSTLANEILCRSELSISSKAEDIDDENGTRLERTLAIVLTELSKPKPRDYIDPNPPHAPHRFSLIPLNHCQEYEERPFEDVHEAIRFFISRMRSSGVLKSHASDIITVLRQHRTKLSRTVVAVEDDLANTQRAADYERYATLLMANLSAVEKGMKSVALNVDGHDVEVPIDPRLTAIQNAQRYFEKTKKSKLTYEQSRERLTELRATLGLAEELLTEVESILTKEELKSFMTERAKELEQFGIGEKAEEREQLPFRIFTVDGGFEVWAGKSSRNNDELTMKYAKPNDLWFHARGSSGSHVILKTNTGNGEPGKKAREQAAGIAAYYSKMKNAKMVPVAMTEKKYVRKPKGAPPGTVTLEREKVIFAEPALPQS